MLTAAIGLAAALASVAGRYGYHRDELYFRMLPPAWGYTDQPPLTPAIARAMALIGDEVWVLRLPALLCAVVGVLVIALVTREVGGGRLAQGLAAWGYAFGTMTLSFGHVLLTSSWDLLVWPLVLLAVLRALLRDPRWWLLAGVVVGLSTYNKWLITLLVAAVVGGLLLVGPRRVLLSRWLLGSAALAVVIALPNLLWQLRHGLPQSAMGRALAAENAADVRIAAVPMLTVMVGPLVFAFVVAGVVTLLRDPDWRPIRFLVPALVIAVALTLVGGTQFYYPYGVLAVVFAVGCVPVARFAERSAGRRVAVLTLVVLHVATNLVISLPLLPPDVLGRTPIPALNQSVGDQIGWPTYVAQIDAVTDGALAADPDAVVLTTNYGEAGALARFSRHPEVPLVSGHNALFDRGGPPEATRTVVIVGDQVEAAQEAFERCTEVTRLASEVPVDNEEQGEPVSVCVGPVRSWAELWPTMRHLG